MTSELVVKDYHIPERLEGLRQSVLNLERKCHRKTTSSTPNQVIDLIVAKIEEISATIEHYLSDPQIDCSRKINLTPFELAADKELLGNLESVNMPYRFLGRTHEQIEITYFSAINRLIKIIHRDPLQNMNHVRLYLDRLFRLRNIIVKAKYQLAFDYYNQSGQLDLQRIKAQQMRGGGSPSEIIENVTQRYSELLAMVDSLLAEQRMIVVEYNQLLADYASRPAVVAPARRSSSEDCTDLYTQVMIQYKNLEHMKNLLRRLLYLLDKKHRTIDDPEVAEGVRLLSEIHMSSQPNPKPCDALEDASLEIVQGLQTIKPYEDTLINYYEDLQASVRIYLRLNLLEKMKKYAVTQIDSNWVKYNSIDYGPFFSIYNQFTNEQMYYPTEDPDIKPVKGIFDQLKSGYSNFIFGYGYSGSGKTYTLFGKAGSTPGILQYGLMDLLTDSTITIKYKFLFEIYGQILPTTTTTTYDSKIFIYFDKNHEMEESSEFAINGNPQALFDYSHEHELGIHDGSNVVGTFDDVISKITRIRIANGHIKETVNNPESSRGHLFLTFEVVRTDPNSRARTSSYLTVVDMAGIENPQMISDMYFTGATKSEVFSSLGDKSSQTRLATKLKGSASGAVAKKIVSNVVTILSEGLFINETINHLKYRLLARQDIIMPFTYQVMYGKSGEVGSKPIGSDKYDPSHFFLNPIAPRRVLILILPVLSFLESISSRQPSKFVMLTLLRIDRELYTGDTLNYAQSLLKPPE